MNSNESFTNAQLQVERSEDEQSVILRLLGKSILHNPSEFIMPILQETIEKADG